MASSQTGADARTGAPLAEYTTLRLGGRAARLIPAATTAAVVDAVCAADAVNEPVLVLGGGSNLVISDAGFDGTVVRIATTGYQRSDARDGIVDVTGEAGLDWDVLVARTVGEGLGGLECLSGIPGLVGATPVQNVGAYGVEIADLLVSIDLLDRRTGQVCTVAADALGLAYRTSRLKGSQAAVVLRVRLRLRADGLSAPIRYRELATLLGVPAGERVPVATARAAVLELRRGKGMVLDEADHDTWSAGSFFTNPVVDDTRLPQVRDRVVRRLGTEPVMPTYPATPGHTKLSAAWLIERAGFHRGHAGPGGRTALSGKHTLALTNRGGATTADLLALAREVRDGVRAAFDVELRPEPVLVGCSLDD